MINLFDWEFKPDLYRNHWAANEKISRECRLTVLEAVFEVMRDFVFSPNMSKGCVSRRLNSLKSKFLFQDNNLPSDFEQAMKIIEPFLIPMHKFNVCPNDCIIFRKEYTDANECPKCGEKRYQLDGKTARRNFTYLPITSRIKILFSTSSLHSLITQHNDKLQTDVISDIHDSDTWRNDWFGPEGEFSGNKNGVVLALCLDGVNPFSSMQIDYSLWPIELSILNFPAKLRKSSSGIMIGGIIPGIGTGEPKSLEPYMELLVEELLSLQDCKMADENGKLLNVSVKLLNFVLDFPAIGKVLHLPESARSFVACAFCAIRGMSCKVHNKTVFLENRRYLNADHPLRFQHENQVGGVEEHRKPPILERSPTETRQLRQKYDELPNESQKKKHTNEHGVKGTYKLMDLPYHKFEQHLGPDPMHTIKDCVVNISKILNGKEPIEKIIKQNQQ